MTYLWHESSKRNVLFLWSVLTYIMLMLCSFQQFLQFWIYRALEYLISHLITPGQSGHSSRDTTDQGRGWNFVKIFSMSDRLSQQWKHFIMELYQWLSLCRIMCYVDRSPSRALKASPHSHVWYSLLSRSPPAPPPILFACEAAGVWAGGGSGRDCRHGSPGHTRVTGASHSRMCHPVIPVIQQMERFKDM